MAPTPLLSIPLQQLTLGTHPRTMVPLVGVVGSGTTRQATRGVSPTCALGSRLTDLGMAAYLARPSSVVAAVGEILRVLTWADTLR